MRKISVFLMFVVLLTGILSPQAFALQEVVEVETVTNVYKVETYTQVADNVVVIFDTSGSMNEPFHDTGLTKLQVAKKFLKQRAEIFPDVFPDLNVGLYSYSPGKLEAKGFDVFYPMQPLNKAEFLKAVDQLPDEASGPTLLQNALRRLDTLLSTLTGRTTVFLFTDGNYSEARAEEADDSDAEKNVTASFKPVNLARQLAEKYDVNFQVITTTTFEKNLQILKQLVSVDATSRVIPIEFWINRPEAYTGAVFAIEEDYILDEESREKLVGFILNDVLFDFDQAEINREFTDGLDTVGEVLQQNPDSYVVLAGYTDNVGTEEYNLSLSLRRVASVGQYLQDNFGVGEDRIILFGYGEAAPVADNATDEGRRQNRRVLGYIAGINP